MQQTREQCDERDRGPAAGQSAAGGRPAAPPVTGRVEPERRRFLKQLGKRTLYLAPVFMTMTAQEAYASGGTSAS